MVWGLRFRIQTVIVCPWYLPKTVSVYCTFKLINTVFFYFYFDLLLGQEEAYFYKLVAS